MLDPTFHTQALTLERARELMREMTALHENHSCRCKSTYPEYPLNGNGQCPCMVIYDACKYRIEKPKEFENV